MALCIAQGACKGLTPPQIVRKITADAVAYTNAKPSYGFTGDPLHPAGNGYYGYLLRAAAY